MSVDWHITERQKSVLATLRCERLRDDAANVDILSRFGSNVSGRDGPLAHLKTSGATEDRRDVAAVYIVKTLSNEGLLAFSLKCGEMFYQGPTFQKWQSFKKAFFDSNKIKTFPQEEQERLFQEVCKKKNVDEETMNSILAMQRDLWRGNPKLIRQVESTASGILLIDFCKNFDSANTWNGLGLDVDRPMGEVLFWQFVAPIMVRVRELAGCEYGFLYAADLSADAVLIKYYSEALNFQIEKHHGISKPFYDALCPLMSQRLDDMAKQRDIYFANFNQPAG